MAGIAFVSCCIAASESVFYTGMRPEPELSLAEAPESFPKVNSLRQSALFSTGAGLRPIKYTKYILVYISINAESETKTLKNPFQALPGRPSLGGRPCHHTRSLK